MTSYNFYSIRYAYRFFTCQKTEPKTDSLYRCARLTAYRCTRLTDIVKCYNWMTDICNVWLICIAGLYMWFFIFIITLLEAGAHRHNMGRKSIYNSVCACRHTHINSSVSAPLNAMIIAVMKRIHWLMPTVGSEFFLDL